MLGTVLIALCIIIFFSPLKAPWILTYLIDKVAEPESEEVSSPRSQSC